MTDQSSPITPPPELVYKWAQERVLLNDPTPLPEYIATRAAQWGWDQRGTINEAQLQARADQELEACCEWTQGYAECGDSLRAARRPKPPSLKECALNALEHILRHSQTDHGANTIRRALEALPND
jgi:hypothetical protein